MLRLFIIKRHPIKIPNYLIDPEKLSNSRSNKVAQINVDQFALVHILIDGYRLYSQMSLFYIRMNLF